MTRKQIRLTAMTSAAGRAAKMGPEALAQVLRPLREVTVPDER